MKLTKEKVEKMVAHAEKHGFTKESVFRQIKMNKALSDRANKFANDYWASK